MAARPLSFRPVPEVRQVHAEIPFAGLVGCRLGLVVTAERQRIGIGKSGLRIERHRLPVLAAENRRVHHDLLAVARVLGDVGLDRAPGLQVDSGSPIDLHIGIGRQQLPVGPVEDVEEAVSVGVHQDLGRLALDIQLGEHHLGDRIIVERIVRRELVMPFDLAGLRFQREHRAGVEIVAGAHRGVERSGIADAPIDRVQLRIIGAGDPGRSAAEFPGVALPGVAAGLVGGRDGVGAPQMLAGFRVPAVDEAAGAELGAGDAGQHDAVGDQRRHRHRIAFLDVGGLLTPDFLAGLGIERDDIGVERGAEDLALVERGAAIDDAAAHDPRRFRRIFDLGLPDLLAGLGVDRHRGRVGGDVEDALVDDRLRFLAAVVGQAVIPHRHQVLGVVLGDLGQRTEPLQIVAHAVIEDVRRIGRPLDQLIGRLSAHSHRSEHGKAGGQRDAAFHSFLPTISNGSAEDAT